MLNEIIAWVIRLFLQKKGYGFDSVATEESQTPEDYQFTDGQLEAKFGAAKKVIKENGQWDISKMNTELQKFFWGDTYDCTNYGNENLVQCFQLNVYGETDEFTERYLSVLSGIRNGFGGSPHTGLEQWRENGNLLYNFLPHEDVKSWAEFNSPKPMTSDLIAEGKKWLLDWKLGHDWIRAGLIGGMAGSIKNALKYSPVGVGVYAWNLQDGVYTKPSWARDNHWVMIYGYVEGEYWLVFDSYAVGGSFLKKLDWDYPFAFAKRITLEKRNLSNEDKGKYIYNQVVGKHIMRSEANGEVYEVKDQTIIYEGWWTNSEWLQEKLDIGLRQSTDFTGISEIDFEHLMAYANLAGIKIEEDKKIIGIINKLNKEL